MLLNEHRKILESIINSVPGGANRDEVRTVIAAIESELADRAKRDADYQALQTYCRCFYFGE